MPCERKNILHDFYNIMIVKLPPNIPYRLQMRNSNENYCSNSACSALDSVSFSSRVARLRTPYEPLELVTIQLLNRVTDAFSIANERVERFLQDDVVDTILAEYQQKLADEALHVDIRASFDFMTKLSNHKCKKPDEPLIVLVTKASGETSADFSILHGGRRLDIFLSEGNRIGQIRLQKGPIQNDSSLSLNQEVQNLVNQLLAKFLQAQKKEPI